MKVPLAWLRDYIDLGELTTSDIVEKLASLGFPVESVERRPPLSGVIAGRIAKLEKHPNADRLQICTMEVGASSPLTIVTAATNVAQGQIVPVATIGAQLGHLSPIVGSGDTSASMRVVGLNITPRKMRGVDSQGMLCSAAELGFEANWFEDGILQLETDLPPGTDVIRHYRLADAVLEVEITSNRVDAMSILGIAYELGAAYGKPVREPGAYRHIPSLSPTSAARGDLRVSIQSPDCKRFTAQRFSNVRVEPAPAWMRLRLALAGQRPIDNLVDTTNFVMLELGQPQHAYDFEKLAGKHIIARDAFPGETLRTLDGQERTLTPAALVIADEREAQSLAGLMGGTDSAISPATREIVIESASFTGARVRRMGTQHALRTGASSRHEKSLPLELAEVGAARAAALLTSGGATPHEPFAVGTEIATRAEIPLTADEIRRVLGVEIPRTHVERALRDLGFTVRTEQEPRTTYFVLPPYRRNDVTIPVDVVEEIARVVGYDHIEAQLPTIHEHAISSASYERETAVCDALVSLGYHEVNTLALQPASAYATFRQAGIALPAPVEIRNPLSEDQRFLRFSLLPGLLDIAARRRHDAALRLFEIGHVFEGAEEALEIEMLTWLLLLPKKEEESWHDGGFLEFKGDSLALLRAVTGRETDTLTAAHAGLHPGKTASLIVGGKDVAVIGAIDPRLLAAYDIDARAYCGFAQMGDIPTYELPPFRPPSRFPAVARDLALVLAPEIPAHEVVHAISRGADGVLRDVQVFDEYRGPQIGEGRKSLTVRVTLQRDDATLTDEEADAHVQRILNALSEGVGAHIRSGGTGE